MAESFSQKNPGECVSHTHITRGATPVNTDNLSDAVPDLVSHAVAELPGTQKVRAIRYHMAMGQRGCLRQIRIINLLARHSQLPNDVAAGDGIPDQNGIGEQARTAGLVHDFLVVTGAKLT